MRLIVFLFKPILTSKRNSRDELARQTPCIFRHALAFFSMTLRPFLLLIFILSSHEIGTLSLSFIFETKNHQVKKRGSLSNLARLGERKRYDETIEEYV